MIQKLFFPHPSRTIQGIDFALRLWLGYTMVTNAPVGVTIPLDSIGLDPASYAFLKSLWDTGYLMHATKAIELGAGLALIANRFTALSLVLLMPVLINIVGITAHFFPGGLPRNGALLAAAVALLALRHRQFKSLYKESSFYEKSLRDGGHSPRSHQNDPALSGAL